MCTLTGPLQTDLYYIFQYLDKKSGIESWSYDKFWFSWVVQFLFLDLSYSDLVDDIVYNLVFHICDFIPAFGCASTPTEGE